MLSMILADVPSWEFWLPTRASSIAEGTDWLFNFVLFINVFFVALVTVLLVAFLIKYRHRRGGNPDHLKSAGHSTALELTWTIIPLIIVLVIYLYGFYGYRNLAVEPKHAYEITAIGHMWNWSFTYPNGHTDPDLHVPRGEPVRVILQSQDVIHSLFIPAFRLKKDVVPGRWNHMWFVATDNGTYEVYCAAYCGTGHSSMRATCTVQDRAEFDKWLADVSVWQGKVAPAVQGEKFYHQSGCATCHSVDGTRVTGPSWKDLYGSTQQLDDGTTAVVDDNYVLNAAWNPGSMHVASYQNVMPTFRGQLSQDDVGAIIAYMKSISKYYTGNRDDLFKVSTPTTAPATKPAATMEAPPAPAVGS